MAVILLIVGILLFIGLVVVHEWGHYIAARRNGVEVEEFGIFFPPRIFKKKLKSGMDFTINALPLGGFVKLKGEHDNDTEPGTFGAAPLMAKVKIMVAGVFMNLVTAIGIFTLLALIGIPKIIDNQFTVPRDTNLVSSQVLTAYVEPGSPGAKAGLQPLDQITGLQQPGYSPVGITSAKDLPKVTKNFAGKDVYVFYERDGEQKKGAAKLLTTEQVEASRKTDSPKGYLGVAPTEFTVQRSTWSAPIVGLGLTTQIAGLTFQGLGNVLAGLGSIVAGTATFNTEARQNGQAEASEQVAGPVGIFVILKDGSLLGYQFVLLIIGVISLTLAIMNILPIPALDGGRLWLILFYRKILKKPLDPRREETINAIGFLFLISLIILITIVDVRRFF